MSPFPQLVAVLLAGGKGERLGGKTPKQFLQLVDRPMFCHSLDAFEICPAIKSVVFVVPDPSFDWPRELYPKLFAQVQGGSTRQDSVANALASLPADADLVMIHDAARPLIDTALLQRLITGLDPASDGVIPGIPLEDAIKKVSSEGWLESELDRDSVWRVQTPQLFRRGPLEVAIELAHTSGEDSPDCSQMLTRAGYRVKVVEGDQLNIKVTRPSDLRLAETYLRGRWGGQL
jgi:2-C-methyl-D-erythritol 4-phosphate cytidylyltransferase